MLYIGIDVHKKMCNACIKEFKGTDMFGKAGMKWLRSILSKLSEVDQFIFDAELRHIETLQGLINKRSEGEKEVGNNGAVYAAY